MSDDVESLTQRVAELQKALTELNDDDQLQCQSPLWNEAELDSYPCEVCSNCRARGLLR